MSTIDHRKSPLVPVKLSNGVIIQALIDTGATTSSVSPKVIYGDLKGEEIELQPLRRNIMEADAGVLYANEIARLNLAVSENHPVDYILK